MSARSEAVERLRRTRPRDRALRWSVAAFGLLAVFAWTSGRLEVGSFFSPRRASNLERFLKEDALPQPLREEASWGALVEWMSELWTSKGLQATLATLAISVLAICLAGLLAALLGPLAARTLATPTPYLPEVRRASGVRRVGWLLLGGGVRGAFVVARAFPEYVLAFLLLAVLGPNAWPAVLALGLHNAGILGRLTAESIENLPTAPLTALRAAGARRVPLLFSAVYPLTLGRFLLYFFYRFETCVREASVLGLLGFVSLGYWIQEARAAHFYDEMLYFVGLGVCIVVLADGVSVLARRFIRRA